MKPADAIAVLRRARYLFEKGRQVRVCFAIDEAGRQVRKKRVANHLRKWVGASLGNHSCYEDWLIRHHPEFAASKDIKSWDHAEKLRPGRIAWIDWMISELETKGCLP